MTPYQQKHHKEDWYKQQKAEQDRRLRLNGRDDPEFQARRNAAHVRWLSKPENAGRAYEYHRQAAARFPERVRAYKKVQYAIRVGKLTRPTNCPECGVGTRLHAHHEDYGKPLDVKWLCALCHGKTRRRL